MGIDAQHLARQQPHVKVDVQKQCDECARRMRKDPARASDIYSAFLTKIQRQLPGMQERLQSMPQAYTAGHVARQLSGVGEHLAQLARSNRRAPVIVHGNLRGTQSEPALFRESLKQARKAGIRQVVIEQPEGMAELDGRLGGPALKYIREGRPVELEQLLMQAGVGRSRTYDSLLNCARNVYDARAQHFQVSFLDLAGASSGTSEGRNGAMAMALYELSAQGQGVLAAVPAFNVGDVTSYVSLTGTPVQGLSFLNDDPQAVMCLGHYSNRMTDRLPNMKVMRVANQPLSSAVPGPAPRNLAPGQRRLHAARHAAPVDPRVPAQNRQQGRRV